jgi:hypothetical protein
MRRLSNPLGKHAIATAVAAARGPVSATVMEKAAGAAIVAGLVLLGAVLAPVL